METTAAVAETPQGPGRLLIDAAEEPAAILVLGHGAGGGPNAMDLELLARRMPERGTTVVRFEQPWRTAGRRIAVRPAKLDEAWLAAMGWLLDQPWATYPLFVGGAQRGSSSGLPNGQPAAPCGHRLLSLSAAFAGSTRQVAHRRTAGSCRPSAGAARILRCLRQTG